MTVTAAEAARKAAVWAERAEADVQNIAEAHTEIQQAQLARNTEKVRHWKEAQELFEAERRRSVEMANMWSGIARALPVREGWGAL
jgi:hypothetical protein